MVSLKTIAKQCGVSTATVSKALNDQKDISEETKIRVRETAEQLGYFPNAAARALKTNRSYNIGVLFEEEAGSGLTHEYFSGVLNGFKTQAEKMGYDITFINSCFEKRKMSYYEHCRYRNFQGIAIVCADFESPDVIELMNSDMPVVTIDYVHHNCSAVCSNNIQGMEELVKYIYSMGHRKIAYIHGQDTSNVTSMGQLFAKSNINVFPNWDVSKVTNTYYMFYNCKKLTEFRMDMSLVTSADNMFKGCTSLSDLYISNLKASTDISDCPLTDDSAHFIFFNLQDVTDKTLTVSSKLKHVDIYADLATSRGWTVTLV